MAVNVYGVLGIALFYVVILVIGLLAARKRGQQDTEASSEEVMLAGRSIGTFVGTFTMTGKISYFGRDPTFNVHISDVDSTLSPLMNH